MKLKLLTLSEHIQIDPNFSNPNRKYRIYNNKPTCYCEFLGSAGLVCPINVDLALIFASVGDSDLGQRVQEILRGAGGLGVDSVAVLVYSVLTTQYLLARTADIGPASQSHIGVPSHISAGLDGQGDVS